MEWDCRNCLFFPSFAVLPYWQACVNFTRLSIFYLSDFFFPFEHPPVFLLSIFSPDVTASIDNFPPLLYLFLSVSPLCLSLPLICLSSFPRGLPVWYSTCVAGQQDGLEHGQAPQTTLIYRTAFQSLLQCCSTYINTSRGREPRCKREKKWK